MLASIFASRSLRRFRQLRIAAIDHPLRAQHGGLDLVGRQHQGRHVEALVEHVADAGLATNWDPLSKERSDVAIDGAFGRLEFGRHRIRRDRLFRAAQDLDDLEKTVRFPHVCPLPHPCCTSCCQQGSGRYVSSGSNRSSQTGGGDEMIGVIAGAAMIALKLVMIAQLRLRDA